MVLLADLESAYRSQQSYLALNPNIIERDYFRKIQFSASHVEIISGIRRCGKSTLLKQLAQKYDHNISYFNFEDTRILGFEVSDFQKLERVMPSNTAAYFFDEIQNIPSWEVFIRQLHDQGKKVFITGSNASLLSKDLGTRLTGRHLRHELFPFSFLEFLAFQKVEPNKEAIDLYMQNGGFPEYLSSQNPEILQTLLKDIVLRDVAIRYGIKNTKTLMDITLFLISNIGKETSFNSLRKAFSVGAANTVSDYLIWLEDSYVFFFLPRFSWSFKNTTINPRKVYAIDNGFVMVNSLSFSSDRGRLLENMVYLWLRQRYLQLYYFRDKGECDFVVLEKNQPKMAIQVCEEINGDTQKREIAGLREAMTFLKLEEGIIITKNQEDQLIIDNHRIALIPISTFLMASNSPKTSLPLL
jgi:uncharacterized protein